MAFINRGNDGIEVPFTQERNGRGLRVVWCSPGAVVGLGFTGVRRAGRCTGRVARWASAGVAARLPGTRSARRSAWQWRSASGRAATGRGREVAGCASAVGYLATFLGSVLAARSRVGLVARLQALLACETGRERDARGERKLCERERNGR
jgi:hypothetical protein